MSTPWPWLPEGTVYGTLLNFRREFELWRPRMSEPPYKAPATAPVLYVKTANTFAPAGGATAVAAPVQVGAALGLIVGDGSNRPPGLMGKARSAIENQVDQVPPIAACVLLDDLSLPHESYYRPAIRYRNRDGFLVCGTPRAGLALADIATLRIETRVNGALVQTTDLATLVRDAAALLADVGRFMTLRPGDVLMLGTDSLADGSRPLAVAGDQVEIHAPGFAPLVHTFAQEAA